MLQNIWSLMNDPVIICLTLFVLWILSLQKRKQVQYFLEGRLANQHTINNLILNSISINGQESQAEYLRFVASFVNYGYKCQDLQTVSIDAEIQQIQQMVKAFELSNDISIVLMVDEQITDEKIIPFSLITIVENALKYGDLENANNLIRIQLVTLPDNLIEIIFSGYNLPNISQIDKPQKGHGLYFLKQRLKYIHFEKNTRSIKNEKYMYVDVKSASLKLIMPR